MIAADLAAVAGGRSTFDKQTAKLAEAALVSKQW